MKQQRTTATVVRGLLRSKRDNRLAFVFRMRANFPIYRRKWSLPGGKVEPGQTPVEALIEELSQEIGVKVTPQMGERVHGMVRAAHDDVCERIDLFYRINSYEGEIENAEPSVHNAIGKFDLDELPSGDVVPHELHALSAIVRGERESLLDIAWLTANGYRLRPQSAIEEGVSA